MTDDIVFLRDCTGNDTFDEKNRGWWVLMNQTKDSNIILFTGLRQEIAENLKDRIDLAINRYIKNLSNSAIAICNRRRDENVVKGERIRDAVRLEIQEIISKHFDKTEEETWCKCDTCTLIRLKAEDEKIINSLAIIGLQYLLDENFNGASALYYKHIRGNE